MSDTQQTDANELSFCENVRTQVGNRENVRPETIASILQLPNGKAVRGFLRMTFTRPVEMKGSTWLLTNAEAHATIEHFLSKRSDYTAPIVEDDAD